MMMGGGVGESMDGMMKEDVCETLAVCGGHCFQTKQFQLALVYG